MKRIPAYSIGWIAKEYIMNNKIFKVHSASPKGIYVELGGDIVFDIAISRIRSEAGITINPDAFSGWLADLSRYISRGDLVIVDGDLIALGNTLEIDLRGAEVYIADTLRRGKTCGATYNKEDFEWLARKTANIAILPEKLSAEEVEALNKIIGKIHRITGKGNIGEDLFEILREYIGLGKGLTPIFDDFATGILTIYNSLATICSGKRPLELNTEDLKRTTDISRYMLRNAAKGAIYEPIEKILSADNRYEMLEHIIDLLGIGHSSGAAFSLGVITGLMISILCQLHLTIQ